MRKIVFLITIGIISAITTLGQQFTKLQIGDKATLTGLKMQSVNGKMISIADIKKGNGILVLFSSNACPFVLRWEGRYPEIKELADANNIGMIVLNSNHQNRDGVDSFDEMKKHAAEKGYNFDYVLDEDSRIANTFGGQTTPHAFLFNGKMELVYKGAIDDNAKNPSEVKESYLKNAIRQLGKDEKITVPETQPTGCSIKRKLG